MLKTITLFSLAVSAVSLWKICQIDKSKNTSDVADPFQEEVEERMRVLGIDYKDLSKLTGHSVKSLKVAMKVPRWHKMRTSISEALNFKEDNHG